GESWVPPHSLIPGGLRSPRRPRSPVARSRRLCGMVSCVVPLLVLHVSIDPDSRIALPSDGAAVVPSELLSLRNTRQPDAPTTTKRRGPSSKPPTTTVARGRCTWLPIPVAPPPRPNPLPPQTA